VAVDCTNITGRQGRCILVASRYWLRREAIGFFVGLLVATGSTWVFRMHFFEKTPTYFRQFSMRPILVDKLKHTAVWKFGEDWGDGGYAFTTRNDVIAVIADDSKGISVVQNDCTIAVLPATSRKWKSMRITYVCSTNNTKYAVVDTDGDGIPDWKSDNNGQVWNYVPGQWEEGRKPNNSNGPSNSSPPPKPAASPPPTPTPPTVP
jgi:hypothetical protein